MAYRPHHAASPTDTPFCDELLHSCALNLSQISAVRKLRRRLDALRSGMGGFDQQVTQTFDRFDQLGACKPDGLALYGGNRGSDLVTGRR